MEVVQVIENEYEWIKNVEIKSSTTEETEAYRKNDRQKPTILSK